MIKREKWIAILGSIVLLVAVFLPKRALAQSASPAIPQDQVSWKIELNTDGIYRLSYAELAAAGMQVDQVDPRNFELMWRGQSVAYQFEGDNDGRFEPNEAVLFYGWQFDGPRAEQQYVPTNVFWLWADGDAARVTSVANNTASTQVDAVSAEITHEPENTFTLTYTRYWDDFVNEFDSWYWAYMTKTAAQPASYSFDVDVPHPAASDQNATYLLELLTIDKTSHAIRTQFNQAAPIDHSFDGKISTNITQTISQTALLAQNNTVTVDLNTEGVDRVFLNRISVSYLRDLIADDNTLQFNNDFSGAQTFAIRGLDSAETDLLFWNISNRTQPIAINTNNSFDAANNSHRFGSVFAADSQFIATSRTALASPDAVTAYVASDLNPQNGAEWVAIAHNSLLTETQRLAEYRSAHSRMSSHVVDVQDIINQYGYGLPLPDAIRDYLMQANANWTVKPGYVLLAGDSTLNPRQIECQTSCFDGWTVEESMVPTYFMATDRQVGLVPSDHFYSTLEGNDDLPDVALGRLPANTSAEMAAMIDKIITYEDNLTSASAWQQNMLYLSDNTDGAGNFCNYNRLAMDTFAAFKNYHYCLDEIAVETLRANMFSRINDGVLMVNYLGHGFIDGWASERILNHVDLDQLTNIDKPFIQISGNCLDGNFAWVAGEAISESLLQSDSGGSVAHWGATGLGYMVEHKILHRYFREALFDEDLTRIGDAITFAKRGFINYRFYAPQAYSSTLLGDPAMQIMHADISVDQHVADSTFERNEPLEFHVAVTNNGVLASDVTIEFDLPASVTIDRVESSHPIEMTDRGFTAIVEDLSWGESAEFTVTTHAVNRGVESVSSSVSVTSDSFEANINDNVSTTTVYTTSPTAVQLHDTAATATSPINLLTAVLLLLGLSGGSILKQKQPI